MVAVQSDVEEGDKRSQRQAARQLVLLSPLSVTALIPPDMPHSASPRHQGTATLGIRGLPPATIALYYLDTALPFSALAVFLLVYA